MSTTEPPPEPTAEPPKARNRRRIVAIAATVVLLATGGTLIAVAATAQKSPPQPPSSQAQGTTSAPTSAATTSMAPKPAPVPRRTTARPTHAQPKPKPTVQPTTPIVETPATKGTVLAASVPTRVDVPAIGASSQLLRLGVNKDGTVQVPPVEEKVSHAGWYDKSPTPGQLGPAIILGHIDSAKYGPGVFFKLGALKPGDKVNVTRSDGTVAVFTIDKVEEYSKTKFPTLDVYGNIDHAGLRLITCGGKFDPSVHSYESNIVAYASLTSTHKA